MTTQPPDTAAAEKLAAEIERLNGLVYVNGLFKCAKCKFQGSYRNMNMAVGTITSNDSPHQCPNGCGPLWRVAAKEDREEIIASVEGIIVPLREERDQATAEAAVLLEHLGPFARLLGLKGVSGLYEVMMQTHHDSWVADAARVIKDHAPLAAAHLSEYRRLVEGQTWQPMSDLSGPHARVNMIHHATYDMYFAIITDRDAPDKSALIWGRGEYQMFRAIDPPSNEEINSIRAGVKP